MSDVVFGLVGLAVGIGLLLGFDQVVNMIEGEAYPQEITIERKEIEIRRECQFFGLNCPELKSYYINGEKTTQETYVKLEEGKKYTCPVTEKTRVVKYSKCEEK